MAVCRRDAGQVVFIGAENSCSCCGRHVCRAPARNGEISRRNETAQTKGHIWSGSKRRPQTASWIAGVFKFESSQIIKPPEKLQFDPVAELEHCISFVRFEGAWPSQESKNSGPWWSRETREGEISTSCKENSGQETKRIVE